MKKISALALGIASSLVATAALAQEPAPAAATTASSGSSSEVKSGVSVAALVGDVFSDWWNIGFGARVGYNISNIYIGGTFVYHLGKSIEPAPGYKSDLKTMLYGVEGGYELAAGPMMIRPYAGIGMASVKNTFTTPDINLGIVNIPGTSTETSDSKLTIWPGVTAMYPMGSAFVGADVRYIAVTGVDVPSGVASPSGLGVYLTAGAKF